MNWVNVKKFCVAIFVPTLLLYVIVFENSHRVGLFSKSLSLWSNEQDLKKEKETFHKLSNQVRGQAIFYNHQIEQNRLWFGMVVNQYSDGRFHDECDSLLFSSLRYVSLIKLGLHAQADRAWRGIVRSKSGGHWFRHPKCFQPTSRDMLVGLLIALTQKPDQHQKLLLELINKISQKDGYFSDGPFYVSYLSPGIADIIRLQLKYFKMDRVIMPKIVHDGFSTSELEVLINPQGFKQHLTALVLWAELEMQSKLKVPERRLLFGELFPVGWMRDGVLTQRQNWISHMLLSSNRGNLFFRWLRYKTADALTYKTKNILLQDLLAMPQFPRHRLPNNCDRDADYLWQRSVDEYLPTSAHCDLYFSGVDFLWMASLILDEEKVSTKLLSH